MIIPHLLNHWQLQNYRNMIKILHHKSVWEPTLLPRLQEGKYNVLKEKQKNEALKAQLDAERQKNNSGEIGTLVIPSSFGLFF